MPALCKHTHPYVLFSWTKSGPSMADPISLGFHLRKRIHWVAQATTATWNPKTTVSWNERKRATQRWEEEEGEKARMQEGRWGMKSMAKRGKRGRGTLSPRHSGLSLPLPLPSQKVRRTLARTPPSRSRERTPVTDEAAGKPTAYQPRPSLFFSFSPHPHPKMDSSEAADRPEAKPLGRNHVVARREGNRLSTARSRPTVGVFFFYRQPPSVPRQAA